MPAYQDRLQEPARPSGTPLTQIRPVTGRYLAEESEVPRYYTADLTEPYQWYGTYGSPCLQLVYGCDNRKHKGPRKPPTCPPVPFPAEPP